MYCVYGGAKLKGTLHSFAVESQPQYLNVYKYQWVATIDYKMMIIIKNKNTMEPTLTVKYVLKILYRNEMDYLNITIKKWPDCHNGTFCGARLCEDAASHTDRKPAPFQNTNSTPLFRGSTATTADNNSFILKVVTGTPSFLHPG